MIALVAKTYRNRVPEMTCLFEPMTVLDVSTHPEAWVLDRAKNEMVMVRMSGRPVALKKSFRRPWKFGLRKSGSFNCVLPFTEWADVVPYKLIEGVGPL
jgi:hypothetical protein